ncbi:4Fe-4S dicluster domain-containing protein [Desulfuribacillus alkaliarsenatis]|uniref:4Fe-4S ferredoxin-type domain-containing protein n=1 Tax=Desulfuribacillus alkaliarsenatis TaxID=766136 RepID=A0A1E5G3U3_9FIRM|nr:4Fe-4S dicluster domain-containing protein [Desulfuribacillus alkaliarsenatis]OEF97662.1 hypothetical protein BHF68_14255 [Desulfuribacillus alkaliarsenatis]
MLYHQRFVPTVEELFDKKVAPEDKFSCWNCHGEVLPEYLYCPGCGQEARFCRTCKTHIEADETICPTCIDGFNWDVEKRKKVTNQTFQDYVEFRLGGKSGFYDRYPVSEERRDLFRDYVKERQGNLWTIRTRVDQGNINLEQMRTVTELVEKYQLGDLHWTDRQGLQLINVDGRQLFTITRQLAAVGLYLSPRGGTVRNTIACPSLPDCRNGLIHAYGLAKILNSRYKDITGLPHKFKLSVAGCPNSCTRAQAHDIGVMGTQVIKINQATCTGCGHCANACKEDAITIKDQKATIDYSACVDCGMCHRACPTGSAEIAKAGVSLYVGGCGGRHPQNGKRLLRNADVEQIFPWIEALLTEWKTYGEKRWRLGRWIEYVGWDEFKAKVSARVHAQNTIK